MKEKPTYETEKIKAFMKRVDLSAMDLVRMCGIAVSSAYKIDKAKPLSDLDVIYRVYVGLKQSGYQVTWAGLTGIE